MPLLLYLVLINAIFFGAFAGTAFLVLRQVEFILLDETYIDMYLQRLQKKHDAQESVFGLKVSQRPVFQEGVSGTGSRAHTNWHPDSQSELITKKGKRKVYSFKNFKLFFGSRWSEWCLFFLPMNCGEIHKTHASSS